MFAKSNLHTNQNVSYYPPDISITKDGIRFDEHTTKAQNFQSQSRQQHNQQSPQQNFHNDQQSSSQTIQNIFQSLLGTNKQTNPFGANLLSSLFQNNPLASLFTSGNLNQNNLATILSSLLNQNNIQNSNTSDKKNTSSKTEEVIEIKNFYEEM